MKLSKMTKTDLFKALEQLEEFCEKTKNIPTQKKNKGEEIFQIYSIFRNMVSGKGDEINSSIFQSLTEDELADIRRRITKLQALYRKKTVSYSAEDMESFVCNLEEMCRNGKNPTIYCEKDTEEYRIGVLVNNHMHQFTPEQRERIRKARASVKGRRKIIQMPNQNSTVSSVTYSITDNNIQKAQEILDFCISNGRKPKVKERLHNQMTYLGQKFRSLPPAEKCNNIENQFREIMAQINDFRTSSSTSYIEEIFSHSFKSLYGKAAVKKVNVVLPSYTGSQRREWDIHIKLFNAYINIDGQPHMAMLERDTETIRDLFMYDPDAIAIRIRFDGIPEIEPENDRTFIINMGSTNDLYDDEKSFVIVKKVCQQVADFCCKIHKEKLTKIPFTKDDYECEILPKAKKATGVKNQIKEKFYENIAKYPYYLSGTTYLTETEEDKREMLDKKHAAVWFSKNANFLDAKEKEYLMNRPDKEEYEISKECVEEMLRLGCDKESILQFAIMSGIDKQYWIQQYIA